MKKIKWLLSSVAIANVTALPLSFGLTSCGKHSLVDEKLAKEIYDKAMEYFVGTDWKGGICSIPHGTGNLDGIREYLDKEIRKFNIVPNYDDYGNMWYDVPATPGCEEWKKLCFQAHMDMVWAPEEGYQGEHPTPVLTTVGGKQAVISMGANGKRSSLGADDGVGVALMLAITANQNLKHGPIRCLITADEETGMNGAAVMGKREDGDINVVSHEDGFDYMLNLDAESEGDVFLSCAGGYSAKYELAFMSGDYEPISEDESLYQVDIFGGMGGHSGFNMINNPVNTVKSIAGYLTSLEIGAPIKLVAIDSYKDVANVIPEKATFIISMPKVSPEQEHQRIQQYQKIMSTHISSTKHFHPKETNLDGTFKAVENPDLYTNELSVEKSKYLLDLIDSLMFGAQETRIMPDGTRELVSSSNVCPVNLVLDEEENTPRFDFMIFDRSEDEGFLREKYIIYTWDQVLKYARYMGGTVKAARDERSQYPAWVYNPDDKIREKVKECFADLGITPHEQRTHGGIECAWWYKFNNYIQQTSIGPSMTMVHNPAETLYLDTYLNLAKVVIHVIDEMKNM